MASHSNPVCKRMYSSHTIGIFFVFYSVFHKNRGIVIGEAHHTEHPVIGFMHLQVNCTRCPDGIVYLLSALFYQNKPKMSAECNLQYNSPIHHLLIIESLLS